jgi:hypothetical protein
MTDAWIELRAYWKLFVVIVQVRCGRAPANVRLDLSTEEADVAMQLAASMGWRALLVELQQARPEAR